jgi:hypothetical protein
MFQFVAVLLLVSMDRCWWNDGRKLLYLPHAIIGLAALTTEFPPVLAPLLLLPYLTPETIFMQPAGKIRYTAITTTVILAVTLFGRADFRTLGVSNPLPIGVAPEVRAWLEQPVFPFWTLAGDSVRPSVVALGIVAAALACFLVVRRRSSFAWLDDVVSALLLLSVSFHNFLLAAGFATALGALAIRRRGFSVRLAAERHTLLAILLAGVIALGWVTLAAITDDWISVTSRELGYPSLAGGLRLTFFGWPNLYGSLLIPWRNGFPLLGLAVTLACAVELGGLIRGSREQIAKSPALTLLIIASTMGIFAFDDRTVGSSFFLYPLALIVVCNALMRATGAVLTSSDESRKALAPSIAAIAFLCLFGISRDFNPSHLLNMRSHEVSFRLGQFAPYAAIWSGRRDIGTPARQLATAAAPSRTPEFRRGEAIIVQGLPAASLYLPAPYTVYYSREDMRFPRVSRDGGAIDVWSRQHLASTESEIRTICESATTLWILRRRDDDQGFCRAIWPSVRERVVRQGKDGRIEVVRADRIEARAR